MPYSAGSLLGHTQVCLRRTTLRVLQRDTALSNFGAELEAMTLPEIKLRLVIEPQPGASLSSDPICVARKGRKALPLFQRNKG